MGELAPCPFCGDESARLQVEVHGYGQNTAFVQCGFCDAQGPRMVGDRPLPELEKGARNGWNNRE